MLVICFSKGGSIVVPRKHKDSVQVHYNSGFFITTNIYPDFGDGRDGQAIKNRLSVFETQALQRKDSGISRKYHVGYSISFPESTSNDLFR